MSLNMKIVNFPSCP